MGSPGPGSYELKETIGRTGGKIAISSQRQDIVSEASKLAPGPGAYSVPGTLRSPTAKYFLHLKTYYRVGKDKRDKVDKEKLYAPGPGAYEPTSKPKANAPGWKYLII